MSTLNTTLLVRFLVNQYSLLTSFSYDIKSSLINHLDKRTMDFTAMASLLVWCFVVVNIHLLKTTEILIRYTVLLASTSVEKKKTTTTTYQSKITLSIHIQHTFDLNNKDERHGLTLHTHHFDMTASKKVGEVENHFNTTRYYSINKLIFNFIFIRYL